MLKRIIQITVLMALVQFSGYSQNRGEGSTKTESETEGKGIANEIVEIRRFYIPVKNALLSKRDIEKKSHKTAWKKGIKKGKRYKVIIDSVNSAVFGAELSTKSYYISSDIPEILKPIFSGISSSTDVRIYPKATDNIQALDKDDFYSEARKYYDALIEIKVLADSLHSRTRYIPNHEMASEEYNKMVQALHDATGKEGEEVNEVCEIIEEMKIYISGVSDIYRAMLEQTKLDTQGLKTYSELLRMKSKTSSTDFCRLIKFAEASKTAKTFIRSKVFVAEKDVVELDVKLVNGYLNDTVYKKVIPFHTFRSFSFDFSTGMFMNKLVQEQYYLKKINGDTSSIMNQDIGKIDIAFGGIGTFSYKFHDVFRMGVSTGVALSVIDAKVRYLVGGTAMFGRTKQVGISGGVAFGRQKVISASVENSNLVVGLESVPTYDKMESACYLGVVYNLVGRKNNK